MTRKLNGQICAIALTSALVTNAAAQTYGNYNKTVVAGGSLLLAHYASINLDCTSRGPVTVRVVSGPSSGSVRIEQGLGYGNFTNEYRQCSARKTFGANVRYTPHKGFTGMDSVQFDVIFPSGFERIESISITVK